MITQSEEIYRLSCMRQAVFLCVSNEPCAYRAADAADLKSVTDNSVRVEPPAGAKRSSTG